MSAETYGSASPTTSAWETNCRRLQVVLDVLRRDVLAAGGDEDVLLAVGDVEEAVVVERADVAGLEPAVTPEHGRGRLRVLVVALEDRLGAQLDLSVVGDPYLAAGQRHAYRAEAVDVGAVGARSGGALREAVALRDADARSRRRTR